MDIYVKQTKMVAIAEQRTVRIKDIAEVIGPGDMVPQVKNMTVLSINTRQRKAHFLVRNTDVIHVIRQTYPDCTVNSIGEMDTVVAYARTHAQNRAWLRWLKAACVVLILMTGSATAIMSFHTDAEIPKVFEKYNEIFFGQRDEKPLIIIVPYALGVFTGIVVFFNHFTGKKVTDDPTPIEIELTQYESGIIDTVLDVLDTQRAQAKDGQKHDAV